MFVELMESEACLAWQQVCSARWSWTEFCLVALEQHKVIMQR